MSLPDYRPSLGFHQELEAETRRPNVRTAVYRPPFALTNDEIESWGVLTGNNRPLTAEHILEKIGSTHRYVASSQETPLTMGLEVAHLALGRNFDADMVLVSTSFPTGQDLAQMIGAELGMSLGEDQGLNIHMACSGFVAGLSYLHRNRERYNGAKILFVTTERYHPHLQDLRSEGGVQNDPALSQTIFSDGAVASVFRFGEDINVLAARDKKQFPEEANNYIKMPIDRLLIEGRSIERIVPPSPTGKVWQNGPAVFRTMMAVVPAVIEETINMSGINHQDIKWIFPHQGSRRVTEGIQERLSAFQVFSDYQEGNFSSGSIPKQIDRTNKDRQIKSGDIAVLVGFGAGLQISCAVVKFGRR